VAPTAVLTPAPPTPYATLLGFTRYVGRTGPSKATFVGGLRRQRESRSGFNPHGSLVKALKTDIQFRLPGVHLAQVANAVKPRWRPLYDNLVPGARAYLDGLGDLRDCILVPVRDAIAMIGNLPVKLNPHFGLRFADGRAEAVRLHFDEEPPSPEVVLATLHLMQRHLDTIMPGATAVLVDLRRGRTHRPDPTTRPEQVERWLAGEAAAFAAIWQAA